VNEGFGEGNRALRWEEGQEYIPNSSLPQPPLV
jgi:hypothetical protein